MLYSLYRLATSVSAPILKNLVRKRLSVGKEKPDRYLERFGVASKPRKSGKLIWVHGASVGEALSALPLLDALRARLPDWNFLITTGTVTSADLMAQRLPDWVTHQFIPLDHPEWVVAFLNHWRPNAVLWMESELWPNMLHELAARRIPAGLINARMRPKTFAKWRYAKSLTKKMLGAFAFILVGARNTINAFKILGGRDVSYIGNLKFGAKALPVDTDKLVELKDQIGLRSCLGFLQTHPTEEMLAAQTLRELKKIKNDLLLIIAPRKSTRGREIKNELESLGFNVALRSMGETITADTDIYVADTIGEMGLWYSLCPVTVIGGSFIPFGGQNPLEGTHFGTAILYGPAMFNFPELCTVLEEGKAATMVSTREQLLPTLSNLYQHPQNLDGMRAASRALANQSHAVVEAFANRIVTELVRS